jgi:hypothetical protein
MYSIVRQRVVVVVVVRQPQKVTTTMTDPAEK